MSQFVVKRTFKVNTGKGKSMKASSQISNVYYLTFGYEILATVSEKSSLLRINLAPFLIQTL